MGTGGNSFHNPLLITKVARAHSGALIISLGVPGDCKPTALHSLGGRVLRNLSMVTHSATSVAAQFSGCSYLLVVRSRLSIWQFGNFLEVAPDTCETLLQC